MVSVADELVKLKALRDSGDLSSWEFERQKKFLLTNGIGSSEASGVIIKGKRGKGVRKLILLFVVVGLPCLFIPLLGGPVWPWIITAICVLVIVALEELSGN